jgi:hypothetical protein
MKKEQGTCGPRLRKPRGGLHEEAPSSGWRVMLQA